MPKAHQSIQNPCTVWNCGPRELIEIEVGARYRRLLMMASFECAEEHQQGDHALEEGLAAYEERFGVHDLHDELKSAKAEMEQQLQLLAAVRYTVEEPRQTPSGGWYFHTRKARPGDLVMVPRWFVGTGRDEQEPEEERPDPPRNGRLTRYDEERMMRSPRLEREPHGEWLTLADMRDDRNAKALADAVAEQEKRAEAWDGLSDQLKRAVPRPRTGRNDAALKIMEEYGRISYDGTVYNMCAQRECTATQLLALAETDAMQKKPRFKPGFLHLIRRGIRVWVEIPFKEYIDNGYRASPWHAVPEDIVEY